MRETAPRKSGGPGPRQSLLSLVEAPLGAPTPSGLTIKEIGEILQISEATVERQWSFAGAWLYDATEGKEERG